MILAGYIVETVIVVVMLWLVIGAVKTALSPKNHFLKGRGGNENL